MDTVKAAARRLGRPLSRKANTISTRTHSGSVPRPIVFVTDSRGWVGERRLEQLRRHLPELQFELLTADRFARAWRRGRIHAPVYFSTWRIVHGLLDRGECRFDEPDFARFMASVTSHQNIGGGLNPATTIPDGSDPAREFEAAIGLLGRFRILTANSQELYRLLADQLRDVWYLPNGVDIELFSPGQHSRSDAGRVRVGWVVKRRAAKNLETLEEVRRRLDGAGFEIRGLEVPKGAAAGELRDPLEMRDFYRGLDFYLCASWHEGTPNPALEAAACGVPIVTTRVGNMPELVRDGENGFFVEPTVESIVERLHALRRLDGSDLRRMSASIRSDVVRHWTWEEAAPRYRPAFERLLEPSERLPANGPLSGSPLP